MEEIVDLVTQQLASFELDKIDLDGRCILVTGAGDGIGRAVALACARRGAHLLLMGRSEEKLNEVYDQIESQGNHNSIIFPLDRSLAEEKNYQEIADFIAEEKTALDGLIHCAGILGTLAPLAQCSIEEFEQVLRVNLTSNFLLTKACIPLLAQSKAGSVVFTSSSVGRKARAFWGSYAVSKFGVEALSQIWADELFETHNIRVNSVNPGATNTAMRRKAYPGETPSKNPEPDDITPIFLYLMSSLSETVNGQQLDAKVKN